MINFEKEYSVNLARYNVKIKPESGNALYSGEINNIKNNREQTDFAFEIGHDSLEPTYWRFTSEQLRLIADKLDELNQGNKK